MRLGAGRQFRPVFGLFIYLGEILVGGPVAGAVPLHVASMAIHVATTLLVLWMARLLTGSPALSAAVALLFALYPRHHEIVFWPASQAHGIAALLFMASFVCYLRDREAPRPGRRLASGVLFALALASSEAVIAGIAILGLYEWFWGGYVRPGSTNLLPGLRKVLRHLWVHLGIGAAYMLLLAIGSVAIRPDEKTPAYGLTLGLSRVRELAGYLAYAFAPFVPLRSLGSTTTKLAFFAVAALLVALCLWKGSHLVRFGACWVLVTVVPYALFVPFGNADRYFYLPAIGVCLVAVGAGEQLLARSRRVGHRVVLVHALAMGALVAYVLASLIVLQQRAAEWREAGNQVEQTLGQIYSAHPAMVVGTTLYLLDLPKQYGQARFLGSGAPEALERHYGHRLDVRVSSDPDLLAAVQGAPKMAQNQRGVVLIYLFQNGTLVDYSDRAVDPSLLASIH